MPLLPQSDNDRYLLIAGGNPVPKLPYWATRSEAISQCCKNDPQFRAEVCQAYTGKHRLALLREAKRRCRA